MLIKILIALGWRGKFCAKCGFSHAAHFDYDIQWHPDDNPCSKFTQK